MNPTEEITAGVEYLDACIRNLNTEAAEREFTADEQTAFDEGLAERARLVALLERHNRVASLSAVPAAVESGHGAITAPNVIVRSDPFDLSTLRYDAPATEIRDRALSAIETVKGINDDNRGQAETVLRGVDTRDGRVSRYLLATGSDHYRSAFAKKLDSGEGAHLTPEEAHAVELVRAASLTDNAGGYAVPFTLDPTIIDTGAHSVNPFRQICSIKQTVTDSWNGVSSAGVSFAWAAEAAEAADGAPTLGQPTIPVHKAHVWVPFSVEIGGDWANMNNDVANMIATARDDGEGAAFAVGSGSGQPTGVTKALDGTSYEIAPTTAETFALADVYKVETALRARSRSRASWVANKAWYNAIRQFDTNGGAGMWERVGAGQPSQLLGYNAYECSDMDGVLPNAAATADNFGMVLGDFASYAIVDRIGLSIELVPHVMGSNQRPTGQRGFYAWFRTGGNVLDAAAFAMLSIPTAA